MADKNQDYTKHITQEQVGAMAKALRATNGSDPLPKRIQDARNLSDAYSDISYMAQVEVKERLYLLAPDATEEQKGWVEDFTRVAKSNWHLNKAAVEYVIPLLEALANANLPFEHPDFGKETMPDGKPKSQVDREEAEVKVKGEHETKKMVAKSDDKPKPKSGSGITAPF